MLETEPRALCMLGKGSLNSANCSAPLPSPPPTVFLKIYFKYMLASMSREYRSGEASDPLELELQATGSHLIQVLKLPGQLLLLPTVIFLQPLLWVFETESHAAQASLRHITSLWLTLNS